MQPRYPRILLDRDKFRRFYLDKDTEITLTNGDKLVIKAGYRFDGQSVPFPLKVFLPLVTRDLYASMVHDFLIDMSPWTRYNRKFQDEQYRYFMNKPEYFQSKFRRFVFPKAVRLYGWLRYDLWGDNRGII